MIIKICPTCNIEFTPRKTTTQKFCSILCHNMYQTIHKKHILQTNLRKYSYTKINCNYCGTEFNSINQKKYCSDECKKAYYNEYKRNSERIQIFNCKCVVCNKQFKHTCLTKYCSDDCKAIYKANKIQYNNSIKICKNCGKSFINTSSNKNQQFCMKQCYWDYRNKNPEIKIQNNQIDNKVKKLCKACNSEFYVFKYREHNALYCSKKCHYDINRIQRKCKTCGTEINTVTHINKQYCCMDCASKGNQKRKSKLSKYIGSLLRKNFNNIKEEYLIKSSNRSIWGDFILNDNIIIECYGDYWHCNPNFYNESYYHTKIKKTAKEIWEYDENRKKFIESNGYIAIFIWEDETKQPNFDNLFLTKLQDIICNTQK